MKKLVPLLAGLTKVYIKLAEKGLSQIEFAKNTIKYDDKRFLQ